MHVLSVFVAVYLLVPHPGFHTMATDLSGYPWLLRPSVATFLGIVPSSWAPSSHRHRAHIREREREGETERETETERPRVQEQHSSQCMSSLSLVPSTHLSPTQASNYGHRLVWVSFVAETFCGHVLRDRPFKLGSQQSQAQSAHEIERER